MPAELLHIFLRFVLLAASALYCFVLPGYALLDAFSPRQRPDWLAQTAIAAALSISLYPLLALWSYTFGINLWPLIVWAPGGISAIAIALSHRDAIRDVISSSFRGRGAGLDIALAGLATAIVVSRFLPVRGMIAPAWGDSVHHTMIVQLVRDSGGLFQSWSPYAPIESFSYHFGFHVNMAAWAEVTGQTSAQAVITGGQLFNVLAVLAVYPVAVRLGGSRIAGLGALIVAGLLSTQPGMYVNWGRYTQLAAQILLPAWLWALDVWWTETRRPPRRFLIMIALLAVGLALTHYRVAIVAFCAAVSWGVWSLWLLRTDGKEWLARSLLLLATGIAAAALVLPWILTVRAGRLSTIAGAIAQRSTDLAEVRSELALWRGLDTYYHFGLLAGSLLAMLLALWRRRQLAIPVLIWLSLAFIAANPFLAGMAGTGIVTNFLLAIGLYLPLSMLSGWLLSQLWIWLGSSSNRNLQTGRIVLAVTVLSFAAIGFGHQSTIVDPFYQMVTVDDVTALAWVSDNTAEESRFLVNAFPAYGDSLVVGSDAGWWLPYYTLRMNNAPPILYSVESLSEEADRDSYVQLVFEMRASTGEPQEVARLACEYGLTHVYLGDRQGSVGFGETQLIKARWLEANPAFQLLHESGNAQVWSFDRDTCMAGL